jgi:signal recognition particle receptor subunit beta
MVQFRPQAREIIAKIVYYGPPLGGKTTNLRSLYQGYPPETRGELVVVPAGGDRTIFFDFLPVDAGTLRGMKLRVQLYTVPGQVHYNATRQVVLRGADGVVFVADSQREMLRANRDSWENLKQNLLLQGIDLGELPHVLQYNKRDLGEVMSVEELDALVNEHNAPFFEAVATVGIGLEETLQGVVKLVARSLRDRFKVPVEFAASEAEETKPLLTMVPPPEAQQGARVFSFAPPVADLSAPAAQRDTEVFATAPPAPPARAAEPDEVTHKVAIRPLPRLAIEDTASPDDPFEQPGAEPVFFGDDVFEMARPTPPPEIAMELGLAGDTEAGGEAGEAAAETEVIPEQAPASEMPPSLFETAIQRVVPRALAQIGDVRELEIEVPVPTAWTGGKRLTLQLRLTLVPEEDAHAG